MVTKVNNELARVVSNHGHYIATLEREFAHSQELLWGMLTEPHKFSDWLAPGDIELRKGGRVYLNFPSSGLVIDSEISQIELPYLLEYSWGAAGDPPNPVCWQLEQKGDSTQLTLQVQAQDKDNMAKTCAAWDAHLRMLDAAIESQAIEFPFEYFMAQRQAYKQLLSSMS